DLTVARGEFCTLLGASGSGKTTLLKIIAGFESPDAGVVKIGGRDVTHTPIADRSIGMVFQNYALFPHIDLTVARGEFCTLLGASGSGKTTLLKIIAGFES
ncbi:Fe3+/spermidine/putrescine ABC transporter ATP-binding protein, partial [Methylobacterium radiotolerans]